MQHTIQVHSCDNGTLVHMIQVTTPLAVMQTHIMSMTWAAILGLDLAQEQELVRELQWQRHTTVNSTCESEQTNSRFLWAVWMPRIYHAISPAKLQARQCITRWYLRALEHVMIMDTQEDAAQWMMQIRNDITMQSWRMRTLLLWFRNMCDSKWRASARRVVRAAQRVYVQIIAQWRQNMLNSMTTHSSQPIRHASPASRSLRFTGRRASSQSTTYTAIMLTRTSGLSQRQG